MDDFLDLIFQFIFVIFIILGLVSILIVSENSKKDSFNKCVSVLEQAENPCVVSIEDNYDVFTCKKKICNSLDFNKNSKVNE